MRASGSSAVSLLLLAFCLVTTGGKIVRTKRTAVSSVKQSEFLDNHNPRKINNELLSLTDDQRVISENDNIQASSNQQNVIEDLENLEHTLSVMEYEPQKINKKGKRKSADSFNDNSDTAVSGSENVNLTAPEVTNVYYEVPRAVPPKKTVLPQQYYPRSNQYALKPPEIESKPTRNVDTYTYSITTVKPIKPRFSRTRSPLNPQTTPLTNEAKLENAPTPRTFTQHRPYPSLSIESRKQKHQTVPVSTTTESSGVSHSTRASRRKKSRQRALDKSVNRQEVASAQENDPSEPRKSINPESRNKSRRLDLMSKYNVPPKPFSIDGTSVVNQEDNFEKGATPRGFDHRNPHDGNPNSYSRAIDPARTSYPGINRKLYERKDSKESSTVQKNVKDVHPVADIQKGPAKLEAVQSDADRISSFKNRPISRGSEPSEDKSLSSKPIREDNEETSGFDLGSSSRSPSGTPSSSSVHQNTKNVPKHGPTASIATPSVYSINYVYVPPLLSTLAPVQPLEASTVDRWADESRLSELRKRKSGGNERAEEEEEDEKNFDGLAEATGTGSEERKEFTESGNRHEVHEAPDEDRQTEDHDRESHEYIQDDRRVSESEGDGLDGYGKHQDKGHGRDEQKYDRRKQEDALTVGSHDNESHQSVKDGGGASGNGDQGKFEKYGGTEKKEEHHESEGENGEKGYKSWHEHEKANKGHHDKERQSNYYDEEEGKEKEHKEEGGYHEEHEQGEKGEKQAEFGEKGEHQKGYSTKGQHSVHKKDEFEKRTEFFDEFHEDGDSEKDGEFYSEHEMSKGGHHKVGHHDEGDHEKMYGKEAKHEKGGHYHDDKGHKVNEGEDKHYEHKSMHGKKKGHRDGKKWAHKKGDDDDGGKKKH